MKIEDVLGFRVQTNENNELMSKLNKSEPVEFLKVVAGFSNKTGGKIFLGVNDSDKAVVGYSEEELDSERNYFNDQVNEHLVLEL